MKGIYEFAIKKDILNSGKEILTPVCRRKAKWRWIPNPWYRITLIEGKYRLLELDWIPELTYTECEERVKGYQQELLQQVANNIALVEFHNLENKEI